MRIAVVDDDKFFRDKERKLIQKAHDYEVFTYSSTKELLESDVVFNLVLLDIEMPDDDGIEFARNHVSKFPYIIFVTSYKERYAKAYNTNVVGFIEKDQMDKMLVECINEVKDRILNDVNYIFQTKTGTVHVLIKTINYFCVEYRDFYVVTDKHIKIQISSFKEILKLFPVGFYQINRSHIVKLSNIQNIYKSTHTIEMNNGDMLEVSVRKWKGLKAAYVRRK